jgi:hypothetical protein
VRAIWRPHGLGGVTATTRPARPLDQQEQARQRVLEERV